MIEISHKEQLNVSSVSDNSNGTDITANPDATNDTLNSYGKFDTKEGLINAYNSLEKEFTRRSQRIKELENEVNKLSKTDKWEQKVNELTEKYPPAKYLGKEIGEYISNNKDMLKNDDCLEKALLAVLVEKSSVQPDKPNDDNVTFIKEALSKSENSNEVRDDNATNQSLEAEKVAPMGENSDSNKSAKGVLPANELEKIKEMARIMFEEDKKIPLVLPEGGTFMTASPSRPKTILEAGNLARQYFKNNRS